MIFKQEPKTYCREDKEMQRKKHFFKNKVQPILQQARKKVNIQKMYYHLMKITYQRKHLYALNSAYLFAN